MTAMAFRDALQPWEPPLGGCSTRCEQLHVVADAVPMHGPGSPMQRVKWPRLDIAALALRLPKAANAPGPPDLMTRFLSDALAVAMPRRALPGCSALQAAHSSVTSLTENGSNGATWGPVEAQAASSISSTVLFR